jgi:hypothetical protein
MDAGIDREIDDEFDDEIDALSIVPDSLGLQRFFAFSRATAN